jgi:phosphate-selective porin OprO/OprP
MFAGAIATSLAMPSANAAPLSEEESQALREEVAALKARLELLERRLAEPPTAPPALASSASLPPRVEWRGSPRFSDGDRAFKAKGRIQADANYVSRPKGQDDRALGFSSEFRRIRLGGEGKLGAGVGYKLELELSDNSVDLVDTFITYERGPWLVTLGNQNPLQSLDELTGDTSGSFMERAAYTDAFNFERRLGLSAQYKHGAILAQAGIFADDVTALSNSSDGPAGGDENNSYSVDGRLVYAPKLGDAQIHVGGSAHWRRLGRVSASPVRYRQRPFVHSVNSRPIGTPALPVSSETSYGAEFAAIRGPWHFAAENHWFSAERIGAPGVTFKGAYAEVGYFLTHGDSRPYASGIFGATKPKHSLSDGGIGAVQINLRYDYLDLNDRDIRGGTQNGYLAALIWAPIQYLRFNLNYGILDYDDAAPLPDGRTSYRMHVAGSRVELDF